MKKLTFLILSLALTGFSVTAQTHKTTARKKTTKSFRKDHPEAKFQNNSGSSHYNYGYQSYPGVRAGEERAQYDSTYTFATRKRFGGYGRTINESTTGVMGHEEIRMNEKGEYRNLNSNTGVPLPPNTGGRP